MLDGVAVGAHRLFEFEALAADPLFVRLAGGIVSSLDTFYRDIRRSDEAAVNVLRQMMADQGLKPLQRGYWGRRSSTSIRLSSRSRGSSSRGQRSATIPPTVGIPATAPFSPECTRTGGSVVGF